MVAVLLTILKWLGIILLILLGLALLILLLVLLVPIHYSAAAEIPESAFADGFELTLDEFAEVQDLLLADPVHDVDVDQGWPVLGDE